MAHHRECGAMSSLRIPSNASVESHGSVLLINIEPDSPIWHAMFDLSIRSFTIETFNNGEI
jgi:hypothetical protein